MRVVFQESTEDTYKIYYAESCHIDLRVFVNPEPKEITIVGVIQNDRKKLR